MSLAQLNQQPTYLALTGVIASPFAVLVSFTSITNGGASVSWASVTNPTVVVTDMYGNSIASGIPAITSPLNFELALNWTAAQTTAISNAQSPRWALQATIAGTGPETLLGGPINFYPPTYAGTSTSTTANLSVIVGTNTVNLTTTVSGGGSLAELTSVDNSIVISNPVGPITDISATNIAHAASVNAVTVAEGYAFVITQSASIGAIGVAETYADNSAHAASIAAVNSAFITTQSASTSAVGVTEIYADNAAHNASVSAVNSSFGTTQSASIAAISISETYADNSAHAASISAVNSAFLTTQSASTAAIGISETYADNSAHAASIAAVSSAFGTTQSASIAAIAISEAYADTSAHNASVTAVNSAFLTTQSASTAAIVTSEAYALTQAASVKSLALLSANNLSDVQSPGISRQNIHNPALAAAMTVATASVSTSSPGNGPWDGSSASPIVGTQVLLTQQPNLAQNGPFNFNGASVALTRPTDYATGASVLSRTIQITSGTYANTEWMTDNTSTVIVDTTATTWTLGYSGTYASITSTVVLASGDATGATDVANLQAAFTAARVAGGGRVVLVAGKTYYINAPLIIGSNTTLDMTGATIILAAGSNCNMLQNFAVTPAATASDGAIAAGSGTLTSAIAYAAGQSINVVGAGNGGQSPLTAIIDAASAGTSIVLDKLAGGAAPSSLICLSQALLTTGAITSLPVSILTKAVANGTLVLTYGSQTQTVTVTGGGTVGSTALTVTSFTPNFAYPMNTVVSLGTATCSLSGATVNVYTRDTNIKIIGGIWNRGANVGAGGNLHSIYLRHIDGLTVDIESYKSTAGKYGISYSDITKFWFQVRDANCSSSSIQGMGPLYNGRINFVAGATGDDTCPILGSDYVAYADGSGDIRNITIGTILCQSANANGIKLIAGAGLFADDITVDGGVYGTVGNHATWIGDDGAQAPTVGGVYGNIDMGWVGAIPGAGGYQLALYTPSASLISVRLSYAGTVLIGGGVGLLGGSTTVIRKLRVGGTFDTSKMSAAAYVIFCNINTTTINSIDAVGVDFRGNPATGGTFLYMNTATPIGEINLIGCHTHFATLVSTAGYNIFTTGNSLNRVNYIGGSIVNAANAIRNSGSPTVTFSGGFEMSGCSRVADTRAGTITYVIGECRFDSIVLAAFFTNAGTIVFYGGDGMTTSGSFTMLQRNAAESVTSWGQLLPFDVATLSGANGNTATNTNAASAFVGPVMFNGTRWVPLAGTTIYTTPTLGGSAVLNATRNSMVVLSVTTAGTLTIVVGGTTIVNGVPATVGQIITVHVAANETVAVTTSTTAAWTASAKTI